VVDLVQENGMYIYVYILRIYVYILRIYIFRIYLCIYITYILDKRRMMDAFMCIYYVYA